MYCYIVMYCYVYTCFTQSICVDLLTNTTARISKQITAHGFSLQHVIVLPHK